jgi:hypothetical protein
MALDIVRASPDNISLRRKMNRARRNRNSLIQPFAYLR